MTRRAELLEQTRTRIIESTVHLHGTLGPSRTTVSAIAADAGVRRSTVYRHFPDEAALFGACTEHWIAANPLPDLASWQALEDPDERLAAALSDLYGYYRRTEAMLRGLFRDEATMPIVRELFRGYHDYMEGAAIVLMTGRRIGTARPRQVAAAVRHAISFPTWCSLVRENGLDDLEAGTLMLGMVAAAARSITLARAGR